MARNPITVYSNAASTHKLLPSGVWRASEQAIGPTRTCQTQYPALDARLPGGGWPLGSLVEILTDMPGSGEISLIAPALAALPTQRPIVMLKPPGIPNALAWQQWQIASQRLWWLRPKTLPDAWWSAETVLRGRAFAAVMAWIDPLDDKALRRLHACAQETDTLMFLFRPKNVAKHFSPCPLRLALTPTQAGELSIEIIKCKGNRPGAPILLEIRPQAQPALGGTHVDGYRTFTMAS